MVRNVIVKNIISRVVASCLGAIFFFVAFHSNILDPTNVDWMMVGPNQTEAVTDRAQFYLGWAFLRSAEWSWPLGAIPQYIYPAGVSIGFTDSIPWLAIILKIFEESLPPVFQYAGIWLLSCYIFQGLFARLIMEKVTTSEVARWVGSFLLITSPVLLYRSIHITLSAHWVVLAAILLNINAVQQRKLTRNQWMGWIVLISFSFITHPYLGATVAALLLAPALASPLLLRQYRLFGLNFLIVSLIGIWSVGLLYSFGYFTAAMGDKGFHYFGADVLTFISSMDTSSILPSLPVRSGQNEGFAYLGLGGIILVVACLNRKTRPFFAEKLRDNAYLKALWFIVLSLLIFSWGSHLRIASKWVTNLEFFYQFLTPITGPLRSSGRFVWPLFYLLLIGSLTLLERSLKPKTYSVLFVIATIIQVVDLSSWWLDKDSRSAGREWNHLTDTFWFQLPEPIDQIILVPPYIEAKPCPQKQTYPEHYWVPLGWVAAQTHMSINSGYLARYPEGFSERHCQETLDQFMAGHLSNRALYVLSPEVRAAATKELMSRLNCQSVDGYLTCYVKVSEI
jgi:hypothetical protein